MTSAKTSRYKLNASFYQTYHICSQSICTVKTEISSETIDRLSLISQKETQNNQKRNKRHKMKGRVMNIISQRGIKQRDAQQPRCDEKDTRRDTNIHRLVKMKSRTTRTKCTRPQSDAKMTSMRYKTTVKTFKNYRHRLEQIRRKDQREAMMITIRCTIMQNIWKIYSVQTKKN